MKDPRCGMHGFINIGIVYPCALQKDGVKRSTTIELWRYHINAEYQIDEAQATHVVCIEEYVWAFPALGQRRASI